MPTDSAVPAQELQAAAEDLGSRFLAAVASQSVEQCMQLMPPLDEYRLLTNDRRLSERRYRKLQKKQCVEFFDKYANYFERHGDRLADESVALVRVSEANELIRDHAWFRRARTTAAVRVRTNEQTQPNGNITSLEFEIEFAVLLGSSLWVHNFGSVVASASVDSTTKNVAPLQAIGFTQLHKEQYAEVMEGEPASYLWLMNQYNSIHFYDGDLTISPADLALLKDTSALVSGDLTVDGVLVGDYIVQLFVLGDVHASSVLISDTSCLFKGTTRFDNALLIATDGSSTDIASAHGPLVVNDSESALVGVSQGAVQVCIDWQSDNVFGDPTELLDPAFITTEGGESNIDAYALRAALLAGKALKP